MSAILVYFKADGTIDPEGIAPVSSSGGSGLQADDDITGTGGPPKPATLTRTCPNQSGHTAVYDNAYRADATRTQLKMNEAQAREQDSTGGLALQLPSEAKRNSAVGSLPGSD
eukprot:g13151.t1